MSTRRSQGASSDSLLLSWSVIREIELLDFLHDMVWRRMIRSSVAVIQPSNDIRGSQNSLLPNVVSQQTDGGECQENKVEGGITPETSYDTLIRHRKVH